MSIKLPYQQTESRQLNQFQQALAKALFPITTSVLSETNVLTEVLLVAGLNTIPTQLDRKLQGWIIIRQRANSLIWDSQDTNIVPSQTLLLNASAPVSVDILVF